MTNNSPTKLVILRPEIGAQQSAKIAQDCSFDPIIAPASEIISLPWEAPKNHFDALMITSANALRVNADRLEQYKDLPIFAVGKTTAALAHNMGFHIAAIGHGGAKALWPLIIEHGAKNILRLVGQDHVPIDSQNIKITTIVTYAARALPIANRLKALMSCPEAPHIFTFHSARALKIFHNYIAQLAHQSIYFDPSHHYAAYLAASIAHAHEGQSMPMHWKKSLISPRADDGAMMHAISEMLGA